LLRVRPNSPDPELVRRFEAHQTDLGYGLLLLRYTDNPRLRRPEQIDAAAWSAVPNVPVLFWSFRAMVGLGLFFIAMFATRFISRAGTASTGIGGFSRWRFSACPCRGSGGTRLDRREYGRQPWAVDGVLPTFLGVSRTSMGNLWLSLSGFVVFLLCIGRRRCLSVDDAPSGVDLTDWDIGPRQRGIFTSRQGGNP